jgi:hypothetical protein
MPSPIAIEKPNRVIRALRSTLRPFAIPLPPASQDHYRSTAWSDAGTVMRHWKVAVSVAIVTLGASLAAAIPSKLSVFLKVLFAGLGAGVGTFIVLGPIMFVAMLIAAPHRQRNYARTELARLREEAQGESDRARARAQFAAALRTGHFLDTINAPFLSREWLNQTEPFIREGVGELEASRLSPQQDVAARVQRLDELVVQSDLMQPLQHVMRGNCTRKQ